MIRKIQILLVVTLIVACVTVAGRALAGRSVNQTPIPRIVEQWTGNSKKAHCPPGLAANESREPVDICPALFIKIYNPLTKTVFVSIDCGDEYFTDAVTNIGAEKYATVELTSDVPGGLMPGDCKIERWYVIRHHVFGRSQ